MIRPGNQRDQVTVFLAIINGSDARLALAAAKGREALQAQKELMREYLAGECWECSRILGEMMDTEDFYYDMIGQVKMDS